MPEPIIEQIADWIFDALDTVQDPDETFTLSAIRPQMEEWDKTSFSHGDCIIENDSLETVRFSTESREEKGIWKIYGIVATLPDNTSLDIVMNRMSETIRRNLMGGNLKGKACGGVATHLNCPNVMYAPGPMVVVTVEVSYWTHVHDGYDGVLAGVTRGDYGYGPYGSGPYGQFN